MFNGINAKYVCYANTPCLPDAQVIGGTFITVECNSSHHKNLGFFENGIPTERINRITGGEELQSWLAVNDLLRRGFTNSLTKLQRTDPGPDFKRLYVVTFIKPKWNIFTEYKQPPANLPNPTAEIKAHTSILWRSFSYPFLGAFGEGTLILTAGWLDTFNISETSQKMLRASISF